MVTRNRRTPAEVAALDNAIIERIANEHPLTLRAVYYRVLSAKLIDKGENSYAKIARHVSRLRFQHRLPWEHIVDGTRETQGGDGGYRGVGDAIADLPDSYSKPRWANQDVRCMVFMEKDTMSTIVAPATNALNVPLHVARGQSSLTFVHHVASRLDPDYPTYVFGLYDYDDNGCKAWESIQHRIRQFAPDMESAGLLHFERLGVLPEHADRYSLETHDHKIPKGQRTVPESWIERASSDGFDPTQAIELDAYLTADIQAIVRDAIEPLIDRDRWAEVEAQELEDIETLRKISADYTPEASTRDWERLWAAIDQRAEMLRKSEMLRNKAINRLTSIRGQYSDSGEEIDHLRDEIKQAPTVTSDHIQAVLDLARDIAARELLDETDDE